MKGQKWTEDEKRELVRICKTTDLFYTEMTAHIDRPVVTIAWMARSLGFTTSRTRHRLGGWNKKHAHLREAVMQYFRTYSTEETRIHFGLTSSEIKSLFTIGYRDKKYANLRKDKRTRNKWTTEELLFLLRHAGIRPRAWIAKQIQRGNSRVIKEKLQHLGINSKTLNGTTVSKYRNIFQKDPVFSVNGDAGPNRCNNPTNFKIVPWVVIHEEILAGVISAPGAFEIIIETMARFQYWIHGSDPVESLKVSASTGHVPPLINRTFLTEDAS